MFTVRLEWKPGTCNLKPCCRFRHVCRESAGNSRYRSPYTGVVNTVLRYSNLLHLHQHVCHEIGDTMVRTSRFTVEKKKSTSQSSQNCVRPPRHENTIHHVGRERITLVTGVQVGRISMSGACDCARVCVCVSLSFLKHDLRRAKVRMSCYEARSNNYYT